MPFLFFKRSQDINEIETSENYRIWIKGHPYNILYLQGLVNYQIQNLTFLSFQILYLTTNRKTGHIIHSKGQPNIHVEEILPIPYTK